MTDEGTITKRQLEFKLRNGHVEGRFRYKNTRDLIRDLLILGSLIGLGHNTISLQDIKQQLANCQTELRIVRRQEIEKTFPQIRQGETFSDYIQRLPR